jgi:hypothetical protein
MMTIIRILASSVSFCFLALPVRVAAFGCDFFAIGYSFVFVLFCV